MGGLISIDTESHDGVPYSIQVSIRPFSAIMVLLKDERAIRILRLCIQSRLDDGWSIVFHHAPADLPIVQKIGIDCCGKYLDTLQMAYHFQNLPQGLKALAYRLLHHRMRTFDEVVGPPSRAKLQEWLVEAMAQAESEKQIVPRFGKRGQPIKPEIIKSPWEGKLRGILRHLSSSDGYNPWERITEEMEERFGVAPKKGIAHCSIEEQVEYACGDADYTLQLALLFDRMRKEIVGPGGEWEILEEDRDGIDIQRFVS